MMKLVAATLGAIVLVSVTFGQLQSQSGQKAKPYEPRKILLSPQPVTKDEAKKVFTQVDTAIVRVMPTLKAPPSHLSGATPITREEVVDQFYRIFEMSKPEFKFTPKKVGYDASVLTIKPKATREKLENLISWGCVDRVGVLATSKKDTMGVLEFGDAVGLMLSRVAELTHMPDPKFTPDLEP